ncbi:DUF5994 family protein [Streptomyces sp.]|uniref:DUF5994 family protein n=1 Tax=Streptomyces sp. TaxID=1931 RepID=UPI002D302A5B|nr:DUF5994 family protein [Streptomyces sp.]HZF91584.1 DUF5994 family protein [Streptomyces sp.]
MDVTGKPAAGSAPGGAHTYRMPEPRLLLTARGGQGPLDGAWWPRCDALELELPALVGALDPGLGRVTRVTVDTAAWPDAPRTVLVPGHVIAVSLSGVVTEAHAITLDCGTVGRWELLVVPPAEPVAAARWLLATAADPGNELTAAAMLALAESGFGGA